MGLGGMEVVMVGAGVVGSKVVEDGADEDLVSRAAAFIVGEQGASAAIVHKKR